MTTGHIKSAKRVLELFEMYAAVQKPLSVTEVARKMEMPQSSTSELLQSLVSLGYLDHDKESRTFYPTIRIFLLSTWIHMRHERSGRIPALVMRVTEKTGETVLLTMPNGVFSQSVLINVGSEPDVLRVYSGYSRPLPCCASGWSLLAAKSDDEIGKIVRRIVAESDNPHWRKTAPDAIEGVKKYREFGYAHTRGHSSENVSGIAIRLPDIGDRTEFAVSVAGPIDRIQEKKTAILEALHELIAELAEPNAKHELLGLAQSADEQC
jgi:DNA-binding IclR family transcriptional regulator